MERGEKGRIGIEVFGWNEECREKGGEKLIKMRKRKERERQRISNTF